MSWSSEFVKLASIQYGFAAGLGTLAIGYRHNPWLMLAAIPVGLVTVWLLRLVGNWARQLITAPQSSSSQ